MNIKNNVKTIDLHKIKEGTYTFTAKVKEVKQGMEWFGYGVEGKKYDYVYFEDISILLKGNWYSVKCSGNSFRAKLVGELANLKLEKGDFIRFEVEVINDLIAFNYIEGKDNKILDLITLHDTDETKTHDEPNAILPKSYTGEIIIGICEALFYDEEYADRCYHILTQIPRYKFNLERPKITQLLTVSAINDEPSKRKAVFYYNPLFTKFFNCSKLPVQLEQEWRIYD